MAFGFTVTASRLGSVLNFAITGILAEKVGLIMSFWFAVILCVASLLAATAYAVLEVRAKKLRDGDGYAEPRRVLNFAKVLHFPLIFWLLCATCVFFYATVFPFVAFASEFFMDKWHTTESLAAIYVGIIYTMAVFLAPLLGRLIDTIGHRGTLMFWSSLLTAPVLLLLGFTKVSPAVSTSIFGITYSIMAATVWSSLPLITEASAIGTGYGVMTALQMVGVFVTSWSVGKLKDSIGYAGVTVFLLICAGLAIGSSAWLIYEDRKRGIVINASGAMNSSKPSKIWSVIGFGKKKRPIPSDVDGVEEESGPGALIGGRNTRRFKEKESIVLDPAETQRLLEAEQESHTSNLLDQPNKNFSGPSPFETL